MTAQIIKVPFHGSTIHTTKVDNDGLVVLKPTLEEIGISYSAQLKKLKDAEWATMANIATVGADSKQREMVAVDLDTWSMLLANINAKKVKPELKPLIVAYQRESAKALRQFWTEGAAVNENITEAQVEATKEKMDEILLARRQEQVDYRNVTRALAQGGALGKDYALVQDTLYLGLFGCSARTLVATRNQQTGERYKTGSLKGKLKPSKIGKNYLTQAELFMLNSAVLMMTSTLAIRFPGGTASLDEIKQVAGWIAYQAQVGRRSLALVA